MRNNERTRFFLFFAEHGRHPELYINLITRDKGPRSYNYKTITRRAAHWIAYPIHEESYVQGWKESLNR